jgi:hypothetical protein
VSQYDYCIVINLFVSLKLSFVIRKKENWHRTQVLLSAQKCLTFRQEADMPLDLVARLRPRVFFKLVV